MIEDVQSALDSALKQERESVVRDTEKKVYQEILQGLGSLETQVSDGFKPETVRKFARMYAIIGEVRDNIERFRGTVDIPLEELATLGKDRLSTEEVRALWMAVRYSDALRRLETLKPNLARELLANR